MIYKVIITVDDVEAENEDEARKVALEQVEHFGEFEFIVKESDEE